MQHNFICCFQKFCRNYSCLKCICNKSQVFALTCVLLNLQQKRKKEENRHGKIIFLHSSTQFLKGFMDLYSIYIFCLLNFYAELFHSYLLPSHLMNSVNRRMNENFISVVGYYSFYSFIVKVKIYIQSVVHARTDNTGFARRLFILYVICYFGVAVKPN